MRVRPGLESDRGFMREVLRITALETYPELASLGRLTLADRLDGLFASYEGHGRRWWVVETIEGDAVGGLWALIGSHPILEHLEAVIVAIAVLPPARGRGSSRLLLEAARVDLEREGIQSLRLFVRSGNVPARSLYETAGFVAAALEMRLERPSRSGDG